MSSRSSSGSDQPVGELGALGRGLVAEHERDPGVAQGVDPGRDRQLRVATECREPVRVDAELLVQVELTGAGGELDHVFDAVDRSRSSRFRHPP